MNELIIGCKRPRKFNFYIKLGYQRISKLRTDNLLIIRTACRNDYLNDSNISFTVMAPVNTISSIIVTELILPNIQT